MLMPNKDYTECDFVKIQHWSLPHLATMEELERTARHKKFDLIMFQRE